MPRKRALAEEQQEQQQEHREQPTGREPGDETPERFPPQRGWKHDNAAGVERLLYSDSEKKIYEAWFKFRDGRPPQKVIDFILDNGYRPKANVPRGGRWPEVTWAWAKPTNYETLSQDRLNHERVFEQVVEMMCEEKGIAHPEPAEGIGF